MRRDAGVAEDELLLGLYEGRPITQRSVEESGTMPEVIYLFKQEIEAACDSADEMRREVRTTVLHELGHHFGLDEDNLEDLGYN
jgi:predicted Zn-dependent protease with MMP-like domain